MTDKPNILFIFSDQQHWQAVGFEDLTFQTPNLDRLASEGTIFTNSFCTTPQCSPSRSSILTGLYPTKTGVWGNVGMAGGDELRLPTIGATLQEAGYRTAYFGKWHLGKDPVGTAGWDEDFGVTGPETLDDSEVTRRALNFLKAVESDKPFALFLSYNNPHDIYDYGKEKDPHPPKPIDLPKTWHKKDFSTVPAVQGQFMSEDQGQIMADADLPAWERYREYYREKVNLFDQEVGHVLTTLEENGHSATTLVVATSDHGDMDGQHGLILKGPFMYEHMMRVPLIMRLPISARPLQPRTVDFQTVNIDHFSTLADFANIAIEDKDGVSLRPFLTGEPPTPERDFVIGQYYSKQKWVNPIRMIRTKDYKYNCHSTDDKELYDLKKDPEEIINRAQEHELEPVMSKLNETLQQWILQNDDPFNSLNPTTRDGEKL